MKLALLGHGQMARVVEAQARAAGHDLGAVITSRNAADAVRLLPGHTVAIDFSVPAAVKEHVTAAVTAGVPLVQGTTGWQRDEHDVRRIVEQGGCGTARVTPFTGTGALDEKRFRALVERQIAGGVRLLDSCGTTGESATLT